MPLQFKPDFVEEGGGVVIVEYPRLVQLGIVLRGEALRFSYGL